MRIIKGILIFPLLWFMRRFHIGDGWVALREQPSREELRQQLVEYMAQANEYENPKEFWKNQR
jgi:hypothetical protein